MCQMTSVTHTTTDCCTQPPPLLRASLCPIFLMVSSGSCSIILTSSQLILCSSLHCWSCLFLIFPRMWVSYICWDIVKSSNAMWVELFCVSIFLFSPCVSSLFLFFLIFIPKSRVNIHIQIISRHGHEVIQLLRKEEKNTNKHIATHHFLFL